MNCNKLTRQYNTVFIYNWYSCTGLALEFEIRAIVSSLHCSLTGQRGETLCGMKRRWRPVFRTLIGSPWSGLPSNQWCALLDESIPAPTIVIVFGACIPHIIAFFHIFRNVINDCDCNKCEVPKGLYFLFQLEAVKLTASLPWWACARWGWGWGRRGRWGDRSRWKIRQKIV